MRADTNLSAVVSGHLQFTLQRQRHQVGIGLNFRLVEPEVISPGNIGHAPLCGNDLQSAAKCHFRRTRSPFFPALCKYSFLELGCYCRQRETIQRHERYRLSPITKWRFDRSAKKLLRLTNNVNLSINIGITNFTDFALFRLFKCVS